LKLILVLALSALFCSFANAAQPGRIEVDNAEIRQGPGPKFRVFQTIKKGTPLAISNFPTEGYYKIRTSDGVVGWVKSDSIFLTNFEPPAVEGTETQKTPKIGLVNQNETTKAPIKRSRAHLNQYLLRAFGGLSLFSSTEANSLLGFNALSNGLNFGGEFGFPVTSSFWLAIRIEKIQKSVLAQNETTNTNYEFNMASLPIMAGALLAISKSRAVLLDFALFSGLGLNTSLSSSPVAAGSWSSLNGNAFAALAKLDLSVRITGALSLFAEGGYRYLKTSELIPSSDVGGGEIYKINNTFHPVALDLSGFVASGGVALDF